MRIGQVSEVSTVWQKLGSSSAPGESIEQGVLSNAPKNFETSLNPQEHSPYATFPSGRSPLYEMSTKGIHPELAKLSANVIASTAATAAVAKETTPAVETAKSSSATQPSTEKKTETTPAVANTTTASDASASSTSDNSSTAQSSAAQES